jgi:hypothetical protein
VGARWFVETRGPRLGDPDYDWYPLTDRADVVSAEKAAGGSYARALIDRGWRGHACFDLIDDVAESALFFDDPGGGLVLLVTGLNPAEQPTDFQNRRIRAAILGVAASGDAEGWRELAAVAAVALRGDLGARLPLSYAQGLADPAFSFRAPDWARIAREAREGLPQQADHAADQSVTLLRPDVPEQRALAATGLEAAAAAGKGELTGRIILLRTTMLSRREIQDLRPWQTLSSVTDRQEQAAPPPGLAEEVISAAGDFVKDPIGSFRKVWSAAGLVIGLLAVTGVVLAVIRPWSGQAQSATRTFTVALTRPWTATGITLSARQRVAITAAGSATVQLADGGTARISPRGTTTHTMAAAGRCPGRSPAPTGAILAASLPCWSLVGRVGTNGRPFAVGDRATLAPAAGSLYLGVNGWCPCDIVGRISVTITISPAGQH